MGKIPVSFKCKNALNHDISWHIGMADNISVKGMIVEADSLPLIEVSSFVEILCFPKQDRLVSHIPEPEPVKMTGIVIWQDRDKNLLGIEF